MRSLVRWSLAIAALAVLAPGCFTERTPLLSDGGGQTERDGGVRPRDAGPRDAHVEMRDTGVPCVPAPELCNGVDDDCDASTPDGADDARLGVACDGTDGDLCEEGVTVCSGGAVVCPATGGEATDEVELCNGVDDDCDDTTDDGTADPGIAVACDGSDADQCQDGTTACVSGAPLCDDTPESNTETCNGIDDDCDGRVDDGAGCPCHYEEHGGHAYLFCDGTGGVSQRSWSDAASFCEDNGYELASIEDEAEQRWVTDRANGYRDADWWIGANDRDDRSSEGTFVWADETPLSYTNWIDGEPNDDFGAEDCAELQTSSDGESGVPGGWNDDACWNVQRYVCEAGP